MKAENSKTNLLSGALYPIDEFTRHAFLLQLGVGPYVEEDKEASGVRLGLVHRTINLGGHLGLLLFLLSLLLLLLALFTRGVLCAFVVTAALGLFIPDDVVHC